MSDVPSGVYSFQITGTGSYDTANYSPAFNYTGTATATTTLPSSPTTLSTIASTPLSTSTSSHDRLGPGAIAGIVIGCVAVISLVSGGAFMLYRRRRRTESAAASESKLNDSEDAKDPESGNSSPSSADTLSSPWGLTSNFGKAELDADETATSPQSPQPQTHLPAELDAVSTSRHELEEKSTTKHELDAEFTSKYEIDESPRKYSWESTGQNI